MASSGKRQDGVFIFLLNTRFLCYLFTEWDCPIFKSVDVNLSSVTYQLCTLDKPFNLSVPQFLHLHGNSDAISSRHGVRANRMSPPVLLPSLSRGDGKGQSALTTLLIKGILGAWDGVQHSVYLELG